MNNYIFPFLWMRGESEEILRNEIEKIYECGIRAICLEARPHDDFCGPGWWHDFDIVLDEAKKRDMKIWILDDKHFPTGYANGLIESKYPERKKLYVTATTADIFGGVHTKTLNVSRMLKPTIGFWEIGAPANYEERAKNQFYAMTAVRLGKDGKCVEDTIDLTDTFDGTMATFILPEGAWRIYVIYKTRTDGGNEAYINMIDSVSAHTQIEGVYEAHYEHYGDEFGKTIAGFFSDEPQFGNMKDPAPYDFDTKPGKNKMPLPWSDELQAMLKEKYGEKLESLLPLLFVDSEEHDLAAQIRYDYMDCVSRLYEKCFSRPVGEWCKEHGVEYIGHVVEDNHIHSRLGLGAAHYFRAMAGQDMAGIDSIGGQILFGAPYQQRKGMTFADGEFFHFALGKMGASAGHLDPKKKGRTLCELFGAYGWSFGVRDMKYLLDHLLIRGVNHLVPHAFSMAEYPDIDCPPHFYARGNNPEFPWFAHLMKYANRMCDLLNGGQHGASVALLYDGEADWAGEHIPMQKTGRVLTENQIEFDVVCLDMLKDPAAYNGAFTEKGLTLNGIHFNALVIGGCEQISADLAQIILEHDLPVYFAECLPEKLIHGTEEQYAAFSEAQNVQCVSFEELPAVLSSLGCDRVIVSPEWQPLSYYHYIKDRQIFLFMNEDANRTFTGTLSLPTDQPVVFYDAVAERYEAAAFEIKDGRTVVSVVLEPGHSCVLMEQKEIVPEQRHLSCTEQTEGLASLDLSKGWKVSRTKATSYPEFAPEKCFETDELQPISDLDPSFSGVIRYEKTFTLDKAPAKAFLKAENVYEVCRLTVNGQDAGMCLIPPYQFDLSGLLREGENTLCIEVATTPHRDQMNYPQAPFDFNHEAMEPTGMFGDVGLYYSES